MCASALAQPNAGAPKDLRKLNDSLAEWAGEIRKAVVLIRSESYVPIEGSAGFTAREIGTGSGVIVSEDGYIVTNAHVVGNSSLVDVYLAPPLPKKGGSVLTQRQDRLSATVLGADKEADIAVLKVDTKGLPFVELGDSEKLRAGEIVLAIGNPLGLENSVSMGVVSAVARQIQPDDRMIYIQTDAPINPGNSGGALVDVNGRLVGINTMIISQSGGSEGLGFAVPSNIVKNIYGSIRERGRVVRGDIGVTAQTITRDLAASLKLPVDRGVIIADVEPKGMGDNAGLKVGDIVLSLDGKPMENSRQFHVNLYLEPIGKLAKVEVLRTGKPQVIDVLVVDRQEKSFNVKRTVDPANNLVRRLRILGVALDPKLLEEMPPTRLKYGVMVVGLLPGPTLSQTVLRPGDIIHAVNQQTISSVPELRRNLEPFQPGDIAALQIEREGKLRYITFRIE
jgi:serine protease Do